jgi:hypothetical protein
MALPLNRLDTATKHEQRPLGLLEQRDRDRPGRRHDQNSYCEPADGEPVLSLAQTLKELEALVADVCKIQANLG